MEIVDQAENERNVVALEQELKRTGTLISVFKTMLYKHQVSGNIRIPPLVIQGFNIVEFEKRMMHADWTHDFSDDSTVRLRGAGEIQELRKDIEVLGKDPDGNRVAFYLCNRWIPDNTYGMPSSILKIDNELKVVLKDPVQQDNYEKLKHKIRYDSYYHPVLNGILELAENFKEIFIPPIVINGIDIVKLENELFQANNFCRSKNSIGEYDEVLQRYKPLFSQLQQLEQTKVGKAFALTYWSRYGRDIHLGKAFKSTIENPELDLRDYFDLDSGNLKNVNMNVNDLNFKEDDVMRIAKALTYVGLKDVPRELVVDMLVKDLDKSIIKWESKEKDISSKVEMYFTKNGKHYLNGYATALSRNGKQFFRRYNRLEYGNTLTYRQTVNMALGRGIDRSWYEKDENGKDGKRYSAAAMFDFDDKDSNGNQKIVEYRNINATSLISKYPIDFTAYEKSKEHFMESVMRGNLTDCKLSTKEGSVPLQVSFDPRENKIVFRIPGGNEVDVTVKAGVAIIKDRKLENEKKNDLKAVKKTSQGTGTGKAKSNKAPENKGAAKTRSQKKMR